MNMFDFFDSKKYLAYFPKRSLGTYADSLPTTFVVYLENCREVLLDFS